MSTFMRLSFKESCTGCTGRKRVQEIRVSRSFFARCGAPEFVAGRVPKSERCGHEIGMAFEFFPWTCLLSGKAR
jgi:hypothetical protein